MLRFAASLARARPLRAFQARSIATGIPVGARAQVLVSAVGKHRHGVANDIAQVIFQQGASIAGTKKVMVEDSFAQLISVYTPESPAELVKHLQSSTVTDALGFPVSASLLDPDRPSSLPAVTQMPSDNAQRRFKLTCPQQPGLVLAMTEIMKDFNCKMSHIDADTEARNGEIW